MHAMPFRGVQACSLQFNKSHFGDSSGSRGSLDALDVT
jgi:hypothetical protein